MSAALADFLLARIAEDEEVARAAAEGQGATWASSGEDFVYPDPPPGNAYVAVGPWDGDIGPAAPHIARHDPTRVLAECEAKRRVVEEARAYSPELEHGDNGSWAFDVVIAHLAQPYAEHPDYDPAWPA